MPRLELPDFALEVFFSRWEFAADYNLGASDAETLSVGELLALGGEADREAFARLGLGYLPTWGTDELRAAIADTYDEVAPEDVLAFAGAEEALFWLMQLLLGPGDHALITVPNYQSFESVPLATGAAIDGLPLQAGGARGPRWALDLDRLRSLLRPETRVVAVNFPNNPTGFVPGIDEWLELVELCERRGIRLVSDEVYRGVELDPSRTLPQAAARSERAVSVNVMSKAYGLPGLRVGWIACRDRELLGRLERAKHYTTICNAGPSEFLAALALRHAETLLERTRARVAANGEAVTEFMSGYPELFDYAPPDGGCVAFPRYLGAEGVDELCRRAVEEQGVILLPASTFPSGLALVPADHFRIGIGRREVPEGLERLRRLLGEPRPG